MIVRNFILAFMLLGAGSSHAATRIQMGTIITDKPEKYPPTAIWAIFDGQNHLSNIEIIGKKYRTFTAEELKELTTVNMGSKVQLMPGFDVARGGKIRFLIRKSLMWKSFETILTLQPDANRVWKFSTDQRDTGFIHVFFHGGLFPDDVKID